ncbi:MAG TPA: protein BatD [Desulfobacterales bacterium]|nr:protein BatD [Desulfobacterales bacterium]
MNALFTRKFLLLHVCCWLVFLPCTAYADISVTMHLDRKEATLVDSVNVVVSVSGTRSSDLLPVLKGLEAFNVTRGGTSSRVQIINGKVDAGVDYSYFIQPKRTGTFKVGPAEVKVDGKTFASNTAILTVTKVPQASGGDRGPLFLSAGLSTKKVYVEEQTTYTLKLYRRTKVSDLSLDLAETEHLAFKQIGKPLEYQSVYGGKTYQLVELRYALIASRAGNYTIEPSTMSMTVFQPRRSSRFDSFKDPFFDDPFFSFSKGKPITLASEPVDLQVVPLPETGRPAGFSGLVGTYQIESRLVPSEIKAGESATLTVVLKGRGNVNRIPDLEMPELPGTKVYADQPVFETEADTDGLSGSKTMKWAIVPEKEGPYKIPPLSVSFFDTTAEKYRIVKTSSLSLSVLPGQTEQVHASRNGEGDKILEAGSKQAIKELGRDILPIHTSSKSLSPGFRLRPGGGAFWLVTLVPFFLYAIAFCGMKFKRRSVEAMAVTRARKAAKTFAKQCHQDGLSAGPMAEAIRQYLNERFGLSLGSLTPKEAAQILKSNGVNPDTAKEMQAVLHRIENAVYTGRGHDACDIGGDLPRLIKQIEKEIR